MSVMLQFRTLRRLPARDSHGSTHAHCTGIGEATGTASLRNAIEREQVYNMVQPSTTLLKLQQQDSIICAADGRHIITKLGPGFEVSTRHNDVAKELQQVLSAGILLDCRTAQPSAASTMTLGEVCGQRFLACARIKLCWAAPYHSTTVAQLPAHIQFLLVELAGGGPYAVILPLLPDNCKATLQPASHQGLSGNLLALHLDSGNSCIQRSQWDSAVFIAAGNNPYSLVDTAVAVAAAVTGRARPRWEKELPDITKYLGWCTWDAFYTEVSFKGIAAGLQSFQEAGVQPRWLIIDDGWQRTGLDGAAAGKSQQQQQLPRKARVEQGTGTARVSHTPATADTTKGTSTSSSTSSSTGSSNWRGTLWWLGRQLKRAFGKAEKLLLLGVSQVADRLNWWSLLLAGLHSPFAGLLRQLLKCFNMATSEHSKRLLSNEFNAKFRNLTIGPVPDTSSTASAADVAAAIAAIKKEYYLKHIYAWHAVLGYWSGVSPAAMAAVPGVAAAARAAVTAAAAAAAAAVSTSTRGSETEGPPPADTAATAAANLPATNDSDTTTSGSGSSLHKIKSVIVRPEVTPAMSDLEPPCNWSQLVLGGLGLPDDPAVFLPQLHSYLADLGIDGVKVDVQNQLELAGAAPGQQGGQALGRQWHAALEASVKLHFPGNHMINCMCHNTNNLYRMSDSAVARVSDDFYPALPASHTTHVSVCAFNSLFMSVIVQPDWDMFHSRHPRAVLHATARMISGGPVYVSDKPSRHDPDLLARLALPGGLLLQPLLPGRPTQDCLFVDPCLDGVSELKVWSRNHCGGVVALFNVQGSGWSRSKLRFVTHDSTPPTLTARTTPADVDGLQQCLPGYHSSSKGSESSSNGLPGEAAERGIAAYGGSPETDRSASLLHTGEYVMYLDSTGSMTRVDGLAGCVSVQLPPAGSDVMTVVPVLQLRQRDGIDGNGSSSVLLAVVGLTNMLNPGGAVKRIAVAHQPVDDCQHAQHGGAAGSISRVSSSGSWVITKEGEEVTADQAASDTAAAGGTHDAEAGQAGDIVHIDAAPAAAGVAAPDGATACAAVEVELVGCGQLLMYCSHSPRSALLDATTPSFAFDSSSNRLVVEVPAPVQHTTLRADSMQHLLMLYF